MYLIIDNNSGCTIGIAHNMFELRETCERVIQIETARMMLARFSIQYVPVNDKPVDIGSMKEVLTHGAI